jgi:hypothetical protein
MRESLTGTFSPQRTRQALDRAGITAAAFDAASGMCTSIEFWLTGKATPTSPLIGYMARLIGCDPVDLTDPDGPDAIAAEDSRYAAIVTAGPPLTPAARATIRKLLAVTGTMTR